MEWRKLGLIFAAKGQRSWMLSHTSLPVPLHLDDDSYRIYFASRDKQNRSHVGFVDLDLGSPDRILYVSKKPVLKPGPLGCFDDHGVYAASLVEHRRRLFMYYIGWNPGARRPLFYSSIGLAVSDDDGETFQKMFSAPIIARSEFDPCLVTSPCVIIEGGIWRMWYVSGFKWEEKRGGLYSYYHIKYAESKDGIRWKRNGLVCINNREGERNIGRPCVIKESNVYKMWYCYDAGQGYRLGYAESQDGCMWTRIDEAASLGVSRSGWDSKAVAYPWVFCHAGKKYLLYNGNDFGRAGFGLAVEV